MKTAILVISLLFIGAVPARAEDYCFEAAERIYSVSAELLEAVSWTESRHDNTAINWNRNKSYDF